MNGDVIDALYSMMEVLAKRGTRFVRLRKYPSDNLSNAPYFSYVCIDCASKRLCICPPPAAKPNSLSTGYGGNILIVGEHIVFHEYEWSKRWDPRAKQHKYGWRRVKEHTFKVGFLFQRMQEEMNKMTLT